ncbi:initiator tRNA phosphoribosyl transferase [Dentipellis sp. KUC8613]|nr:initiator tRNA phosphoribosyl transferase [Dentipellis sp. KUC8613]
MPPNAYDANDVRSEALAYIRRESLDLYNRIHSIEEDITFVGQVREAYPDQAFLPNLRCGEWYTDPAYTSKEPAYFKSTDGHYRNWSFNLRRPNLHLLPVAADHNGLILVDSTRAGKRIPDALSKTVPIWCAVINRAIRIRYNDPASTAWRTALYTPPGVVSDQEHRQIEEKLDQWAKDLANSSYLLPNLRLPLRPLWITPATSTFPSLPSSGGEGRQFIPIICVSASKQVSDGIERRSLGFSYVQGSGDDHELWSMGLTPALFWKEKYRILGADRETLPSLVSEVVSQSLHAVQRDKSWTTPPSPITKIANRMLLCRLSDLPATLPAPLPGDTSASTETAFILISPTADPDTEAETVSPIPAPDEETNPAPRVLRLNLASGKKGQYQFLHGVLPQAMTFVKFHLTHARNICIACESGKDAGVGVALAALQVFFTDEGHYKLHLDAQQHSALVSKETIRTRLQWIIASRPQANPSRTTLKRVNDFLLSPSHGVSSGN